RRCSDSRFNESRLAAAPKQVHRQTRQHDSDADQTVGGISINRADQHRATGRDKEQGRKWMSRNSERVEVYTTTKNKNGGCSQGEENYIDRNDVVQDLFVSSRQRNQDRHESLQRDSKRRH